MDTEDVLRANLGKDMMSETIETYFTSRKVTNRSNDIPFV
jgi:hypothetical protein